MKNIMKFYCIIDNETQNSQQRYSLLEKACHERNVNFIKLLPETFNYSKDIIDYGSMLYRATPGDKSRILEKHILNDKIISFYSNINFGIGGKSNSFFYNKKSELPVIKTIPDCLSNESVLIDYVNYLGGFPVIVKVLGGTNGIGIIKIDSLESLKSLCDFFRANNITPFLRQFIKHKQQGRLIVIGNKVVASHINYSNLDFRTNVSDNIKRMRKAFIFPKTIQDIAINAIKSIGIEFGGVDILIHEETNDPYIAEINFPCFFPMTQELTGIDIAGAMIDYLIKKSKLRTIIE